MTKNNDNNRLKITLEMQWTRNLLLPIIKLFRKLGQWIDWLVNFIMCRKCVAQGEDYLPWTKRRDIVFK